jgi:hypothetical protein
MGCGCGCNDCQGDVGSDLHGENKTVNVGRRIYSAFVRRRQPVEYPYRAAAQINARPLERTHPRPVYDPPKYSDTPARPAAMQVYASFRPNEYQSEQRYRTFLVPAPHIAQYPAGRQNPHVERTNIALPAHVAYGNMFGYGRSIYGIY